VIGGSLRSSIQLDPGAMTGRPGQTPIAGKQRRVERFGERNVNGVVGGEIVPQFPYPRQQEIVGIPLQRKVREIGQRRPSSGRRV